MWKGANGYLRLYASVLVSAYQRGEVIWRDRESDRDRDRNVDWDIDRVRC